MNKLCCLVYLVLTVSAVLAQNQPSPCDLPQKCFPPESAVNVTGALQNLFTQARCYSACVEDERLNLSTAAVMLKSTIPHWPSVHLKESASAIVQACTAGCSFALVRSLTCPFIHCNYFGIENQANCNLGCEIGNQIKIETGNPPVAPIAPPVPISYNPFHFDFASAQPNSSHGAMEHLNSFIVLMNNKTTDASFLLESSADELIPFKQFSCKFVNASFAVVNRFGASRMSPPAAMCGGGVIYPSHVRKLEVTLCDDRDRRDEFNVDIVTIILSWKPPPEAQFVTEYQIRVIPTSIEAHCPQIQDVIEPFSIPKDSVDFTLKSNISTGFALPVSCEFRIVVESMPHIPQTLSADLQQSTEIVVTTDYIGQPGLQLTVMSDWTWNENGFYSLRLNISLPDVDYVREGLRELNITVHTARITNIHGGFKILQILPSDQIVINANQLTYVHTLSARYPPQEDDQEYVFDIRPKHRAAYYNYRMPQAEKLSFSAPSFPPSPAQNVKVNSYELKGNILELNISWLPPTVTNGELHRYSVYVWHLATPDIKQSVHVSADNLSIFLTKEVFPVKPQYIMVLAENYHKAANWSEPVMLNLDAVSPNAGISESAIYGVTVTAAAIVAVLHIILIVLITIICWQRRKNKAVFLKMNGRDHQSK